MKSTTSKFKAPAGKRAPGREAAAQNGRFPVVAIGASAGGLEAYREFFHVLPVDSGMAFVLIQHLDPSHNSMLTEIIAKATRMPVEEVRSGVKIRPDRVYVIPPNSLIALADGTFSLTPRGKGPRKQADLAINFFMRSLAEERKESAIGVVLSGTGGDGTTGLEDIRAEGGITFAQEPGSARYDGMPRSAIDSGCVDFILTPAQIAKELDEFRRHPYVRPETAAQIDLTPAPQEAFARVVEQLRMTSGVDFSQYKPNTIHRRALRRMAIHKLGSLDEYARHLREDPDEGKKLYDDVLIPVTSFFRDFETFESLKKQVYPAIVKDKNNKGTIRMWAPGCSTGEETYSLAMTLLEFLGDKAASFQVQIFGTDLNEKGIQKARAGIYRETIADEISPERMSRFFVKVDEGYRVNKAVRDMCVFARHNLANDPPFSQMNVVACRNLLIYIQPVLQKKIIPILHYALKPTGFLVLGSSESVSPFPDLFSVVNKKHKIYAKRATASRLHYDFAQAHYPSLAGQDLSGVAPKPRGLAKEELDVQAEADRMLLKDHVPAGVIVNSAMEVVQFRGRTTPYLEQSPGKPSVNLLKLARNGLGVELRTLITAATKKGAPVKQTGISFDGDGHKRTLSLSVSPLGEKGAPDKRFFLVLFEDVTSQRSPGTVAQHKGKGSARTLEDKPAAKRLKRELASTRDALHSAIEAEEALKEGFQSANEEILSANEELQSTNEELETSKEELQSANEELNTLNTELRVKNSDLQSLTDDIFNLLNSTRIPVVMLDVHLRIRRFTPTADKLLKVVASDIGRPFGDIKSNIDAPDLQPAIAKVLDSLQPWEGEVKDLEGRWHSLNVLPYRTQDNKIDGVVLALMDIHAIKSASEQMRQSSEFFRGVMDTVREPLLVLNAQLGVIAANTPFLDAFQASPENTVGKFVYQLGNGQWNIPALRARLEKVAQKNETVTDFEVEHDFESLGHRTMVLNARKLAQANDDSEPMILLAIEDVTERRRTDVALRESEERFRGLFNFAPMAVFVCDRNAVIQNYNRRAAELWGREPVGGIEKYSGSVALWLPDGTPLPHEQSPIVEVLRTGVPALNVELAIERPDGTRLPVLENYSALKDAKGEIGGAITTFVDITERKHAETALVKSEKLAAAGRLAATLAHEINNPLQAVTNLLNLLVQSPTLAPGEHEYAAMAAEELDRVSHLAQQSLGFYRETISPRPVDVQEVLESILSLYARRIAKKNITVRKDYQFAGAEISGYPGEIRQVFSTLLINAMEAVPMGGHFALRVSKSSDWRDNSNTHGLRVTLADSGCGIPADQIARIFEPFFTTKGENGTGLGLWVAQGIVHRLGGSIRMRSRVHPENGGTCFSIFLPSKPRTTD